MNTLKKVYLNLTAAALLTAALVVLPGCAAQQNNKAGEATTKPTAETKSSEVYTREDVITNPTDAKKLLVDGNLRYVSGKVLVDDLSEARRGKLVANGQHPFAIIVSCSDSRVPPELLFDQALGDLFVVRVAGNVVDPIALGSIEYAVEHLKSPLIVVMGHEKCGAVAASVEATTKGGHLPGNIPAIVDKIKPSVTKAQAAGATEANLAEKAADENVKAVLSEIETKSPIVKEFLEHGKVSVIGAKYHITGGQVEWFDAK